VGVCARIPCGAKRRYILIYLQDATDDPDIGEHLGRYSDEELSAIVNEYLECENAPLE
jgi:hypothetical protein